MKIAVPYENGQVFQHFGKAREFKIYTVSEDEILSEESLPVTEAGHGAVVQALKEAGVNAVICGGIGAAAVLALQDAGIQLMGGAFGNAGDRVREFLGGRLHFESEESRQAHQCGECSGNLSACGGNCGAL